MELTKKERIFLINQYKTLSLLDHDNHDSYEEYIEILEHGYEILYHSLHDWVLDDMPENEGRLVMKILDLYRAIEKTKRESNNQELEEHRNSFFKGFDGNNESEYLSFARFIIQKQNRFREQEEYFDRNDNMNSHVPMIPTYARMLEQSEDIDIWNMSAQEALSILNA